MLSRISIVSAFFGGLAVLGAQPCAAQVCPNLDYSLATHSVGTEPWCAAAGDIDGDGADELFVGRSPLFSSGSLSLLPNAGNGVFLSPIDLPGVASPRSLALGDLDGDGDLDLAVADRGVLTSSQFVDDGVGVFLGDGQGHFAPLALTLFERTDDEPEALRLGDLDGDGDLDVTVALRYHQTGPFTAESRVLSYRNDGAGGLTLVGSYPADPKPRGMVLVDLDGDQLFDYATVNWDSNSVSVVLGHGDGTFDAVATTYAVGVYPSTIAAGDFDGDADVDLAVGWKYGVRMLVNQGGGAFVVGATQTLGYYPKAMSACDFDQDGKLDLVTTFANSADVKLLKGSGSASFSQFAAYPAGSQACALALGDWNGDAIVDFATADNDGSALDVRSSDCGTSSYCTAKPNSQGCTPSIGSSGVPSVSSTTPFLVTASQVLNHKNGMLFYGFHSAASPFQGGFLCIALPVQRTSVQSSGGSASGTDCTGSFAYDFNALIQSGDDPLLVAGAQVFAQYWSRDPADPLGVATSLTDALRFALEP